MILGIIASGSSIGAYNALAATCRHPELFHRAFCMSGTYELSKFIDGDMDEEERKARDQQLRSSIHTKLIESGEYERCAHPPAKPLCVLSAVNGELGLA